MLNEMPEERQPIPLDAIRRIQRECMTVDDENRWLLALISDTGMRLSEAAGLAKDDIVLDADIPHITVRPHTWRRLKTKGSERTLPLVRSSLWAAERAVESPYLFPRYCNDKDCKAKSERSYRALVCSLENISFARRNNSGSNKSSFTKSFSL